VKIVLQDLKTLEYAYTSGGWTPHLGAAIGFSGVIEAVDYAINLRLLRVRVAIKFKHAAHDIEFPALSG
jgi:hypothetical protein